MKNENGALIIRGFPHKLRYDLKVKAAILKISMKQFIIEILQDNLTKHGKSYGGVK